MQGQLSKWLLGAVLAALLLLPLRLLRIGHGLERSAPSKDYMEVLREHEGQTQGKDPLVSAYENLTTRRPYHVTDTSPVHEPTPQDAETLFDTSMAYADAGNYDQAIETFQQAIRLKPDWAQAHHNLGYVYDKAGRYGEAIDSYKDALLLNPNESETYNNLGGAYVNLERYDEAAKAFRQAIRLKPGNAEAHLNLGIAYLMLGNPNAARQEYETLLTLDREMAGELWGLIQDSEE